MVRADELKRERELGSASAKNDKMRVCVGACFDEALWHLFFSGSINNLVGVKITPG